MRMVAAVRPARSATANCTGRRSSATRTGAVARYVGSASASRWASRLASPAGGISTSGIGGASRSTARIPAATPSSGTANGRDATTVAISLAASTGRNGRFRVRRASSPSTVLPTRFETSIWATVARTDATAAGGRASASGPGGSGRPASAHARAYVSSASSAATWSASPRKSCHEPWIQAQ